MAPVSRPRHNTRRLTVLLLAVVVPPAVALVWLGLRLLDQDRALLTQRETERRESTVEAAIRSASDKLCGPAARSRVSPGGETADAIAFAEAADHGRPHDSPLPRHTNWRSGRKAPPTLTNAER